MSSDDLKTEEDSFGQNDDSSWYNQLKSNKNNDDESSRLAETGEKNDIDGLYKSGGGSDGFLKNSKKKSALKKKVALGGVGVGAIFAVIALNFFLSMGSGGMMLNLDRIYEAYRLQTINRQFARRVAHITLSDSISNATGRPLTAAGNNSLFRQMRGWTPNRAMRSLGAAGLEFNFERTATGGNRLVSVTDRTTGRVIDRSSVTGGQFSQEVTNLVDQRMSDIGKNKFYRRQTANFVRQNSGIRLSKFREFLSRRGENISRQEGRRIIMRERILDMTGGRGPRTSRIRTINEGAREQLNELNEGRVPDTSNERAPLGQKRSAALTRMGQVSDANLLLTMSCIANDISGQTLAVIDSKINGPLRAYADFRTKNDQIRVGDVTTEAVAAETEFWEGAHQSAAVQRALGTPNDQIPDRNKLTEIDYPFTLFGMEISTIQRIAFIVNAVTSPVGIFSNLLGSPNQDNFNFNDIPDEYTEEITNEGIDRENVWQANLGSLSDDSEESAVSFGLCDALLHPAGQITIGVGEVGVTIATLGGVRAATAALFSSWRVAARVAGGASASYLLYFKVIPAYIDNLNGIDSMPLPGQGPQNGNKIDVGALLFKNSLASASGASIIPSQVAAEQQRESIALYRQYERSKGVIHGYLSLENPFSLTSRVAYSLNGVQLQHISVSIFKLLSSLFSPMGYVSNVFANNDLYPPDEEFYGLEDYQFGWINSQIDGTDSNYDFVENTKYIEENFDELNERYAGCFTLTMVDVAIDGYPRECEEEDAKRYGIYYLDCLSIDQVAADGTAEGSYTSRNCDFIIN